MKRILGRYWTFKKTHAMMLAMSLLLIGPREESLKQLGGDSFIYGIRKYFASS